MLANRTLYDEDFYAWAHQQAALLRAGKLAEADIENIAGEIECTGKSEKRELASHLTVLLLHLLKWQYQPARRGRSWRLSIEGQRLDVAVHLRDSPSLKPLLPGVIADGYERAVIDARRDTRIVSRIFPAGCPWSFDQMMSRDFWPE